MRSLEEPLTKREQEVYSELINGKTLEEIAEKLFLARSTVATHADHIYRKKLVNGRMELLCLRIKELEDLLDGDDR